MNPAVSVIIATKDRFDQLEQAVRSVLLQTYKNIEIVVVNDKSLDTRYYDNHWIKEFTNWVDLPISSKEAFGYPSAGYARSVGINLAKGEYIAVLDDDDYFLPDKVELQISDITLKKIKICASEGFIGKSFYNKNKLYPIYHREYYRDFCYDFFTNNYGSYPGYLPSIFDYDLISKHNFIIHSSVVFEKQLYDKVGGYDNVKNGLEDWGLMLKMLQFSPCIHINQPLVYYDGGERVSTDVFLSKIAKIKKWFISKLVQ